MLYDRQFEPNSTRNSVTSPSLRMLFENVVDTIGAGHPRIPKLRTLRIGVALKLSQGPHPHLSYSAMAVVKAVTQLNYLHHLPLVSVILTSIFLTGSLVIVGIRTHVRRRDNTFGLDDGFIMVGAVGVTFDERELGTPGDH